MIARAAQRLPSTSKRLQEAFLGFRPRIETHAHVVFRSVKCPHRKADCIAETIALSWKWFLRLVQRGKDPGQFVSALATYAARAVKCGRRMCGQLRAKDVMSEAAQQHHGFAVEYLPASTRTSFEDFYASVHGQRQMDVVEETLADNKRSPVPDQASFRLAFPQFVRSQSRRDRRMIEFLALGNSGKEAAAKFRMSQGRVSQIRKAWCGEWYALHGEQAPFEG
jgi:hypothetical protein